VQAVDESLSQLRATLEADGYRLTSTLADDGELVLEVVGATPEACLDCLVPKAAMLRILRTAIPAEYERVSLRYPNDV